MDIVASVMDSQPMPEKSRDVSDIYRPNACDAELLAQARQCIKQARAVLELPPPSTFLGKPHLERRSKQTDDE
jgi:hypothetical protein